MKIGYTTGVYDLFHAGHLNILKHAKSLCDRLVVGVTTDELALDAKGFTPIMPFNDRMNIISAIRYVDVVVPQINYEKYEVCKKLKVDYVFVGDDWYGKELWNKLEIDLENIGCKIIYLPRTPGISSTQLRNDKK